MSSNQDKLDQVLDRNLSILERLVSILDQLERTISSSQAIDGDFIDVGVLSTETAPQAHSGAIQSAVDGMATNSIAIDNGLTYMCGQQVETTLIFRDDFNNLDNWEQNTFTGQDNQNRTGYKHLELDGSINTDLTWIKVPGRWAAMMNKHRDKVQFIRDNALVLKGYYEKANNVYRKNFTSPSGKFQPYGDYLLYSAWLTLKTEMLGFQLKPGMLITADIDLSKQCAAAHRCSWWLMPPTGENAYDYDVSSVEVDFEMENPQRYDKNFGQCVVAKVVGGKAGDTSNATVNLLQPNLNIDIRQGSHRYTFAWNHDGSMVWAVDEKEINRDNRAITMRGAKLYLTREMDSGCKDPQHGTIQPHENVMDGPHQPKDDGLTARSIIDDLDLFEADEVVVNSVTIHELAEGVRI